MPPNLKLPGCEHQVSKLKWVPHFHRLRAGLPSYGLFFRSASNTLSRPLFSLPATIPVT